MRQRIPKFRLPAAFVSPASLLLVGGICYYFSLDFTSEEELEATLEKKFPQAMRDRREKDARMREFVKRVNEGDPREEERMRNLLKAGKGKHHYNMKRHHATQQEIEEFGFVSDDGVAKPPPAGTGDVTRTLAKAKEEEMATVTRATAGMEPPRAVGQVPVGDRIGTASVDGEGRESKRRRGWSLW